VLGAWHREVRSLAASARGEVSEVDTRRTAVALVKRPQASEAQRALLDREGRTEVVAADEVQAPVDLVQGEGMQAIRMRGVRTREVQDSNYLVTCVYPSFLVPITSFRCLGRYCVSRPTRACALVHVRRIDLRT
jgi:hypothetical protein